MTNLTVPVGLLRDLAPKRVMRAQVGTTAVVVWRATNGDIAAWDNRCPHRGMALSHGFVRGNDLACLYHGWHYGSTGICRYIPAHPELEPPETIRAEVFSVAVADGVIWVSVSGKVQPTPVAMDSQPLRSFHIAAPSGRIARACEKTEFAGAYPARLHAGSYRLGARQILLLENPLDTARTQITALVDAQASAADCAALSRWCEAMRRAAQTEMAVS